MCNMMMMNGLAAGMLCFLCTHLLAQQDIPVQAYDTMFLLSPGKTAMFSLANTSENDVRFQLKINGGFFLTENDIVQAIREMKPAFPGEPEENKAWRYVMGKVKFSAPITQENWSHSTELLFNSIGNGQCDDLAFALYRIWGLMGFQSRIWNLGGHVVPEVFTGGKWKLYDPSYQVYYLNRKGEIAGVEELSSDPDLIVHPLKRAVYPEGDAVSMTKGFSRLAYQLYSTKADNAVNEFFTAPAPLENLAFILPPGAAMTFPAVYDSLPFVRSYHTPDLGFLCVALQTEAITHLQLPLVPYAIEGAGKVFINAKEYTIHSKELNTYLRDFSVFQKCLTFPQNTSVKVYYLLNDQAYALADQNKVSLTGHDVSGLRLHVETHDLPQSQKPAMSSIVKARLSEYDAHPARFDKGFQAVDRQLPFQQQVVSMAHAYIASSKLFPASAKQAQQDLFSSQMNLYFSKAGQEKWPKKLRIVTEDPRLFIIFYTFIEYYGEEAYLKMM